MISKAEFILIIFMIAILIVYLIGTEKAQIWSLIKCLKMYQY